MEPPYGSHKTSGLHHQRPAGRKNSTTLPLAEGRDIRKNVSPLILTISNIHPKKMTRNQALAISSISNSSIVTFQRPCLGFHVKLKGGFSFPEDMALWWHYVSRATLGPPNAVVRGAFWGLLVKGHAGTRAGKAVPGAVEHTQLT